MSKVVALVLGLSGCRGSESPPAATSAPQPRPAALRPVVLCLGTSLTAGYGLDPAQAYPALLQKRADAERLTFQIVNAGVSGETSAGALHRIDWLMRRPPAVLVLETGANDGLRGQDPDALRGNIQALLDRAAARTPPPRVLLVGMRAPTNYGAGYARRFDAVYAELARKNRVALLPFLLEGVALDPAFNLPDGIHPNARGHERIAETVWASLRPLLVTPGA